MDIPAAAISAPGLQLNFYQIEALFLQLTLIGTDSEMKKIPIFIFYEEWHICSLKQNKKMSSLVFLFSKTLERKFCLVQDSFAALVGCNENQLYFMLRFLFSELLHQMSFFPNRPCFCFDIQIEFQHFWWPVLFYCFLIKSIILCATYDMKFHIWPPGLKIFAGVVMLLCCMRANVFTTRNNRAKKASNLNLDSCQRCHFIRALLSSMYLP